MKRAGDKKREKDDKGFATRTVMALASDMAKKKRLDERISIQFEALATSLGITVPVLD